MFPIRFLILAAAVLIALLGWVGLDWWIAHPPDVQRSYVGGETCAKCHQQEADRWAGSDHDMAMDLANSKTVLGDFDNAEFEYYGTTTRFFHEGDNYYVTTDGPDGKPGTFKIKYTFGYYPLQQYLIELDRGRIQTLSVAWDTEKKKWYHLYPDEQITHDDVLHWTKFAQNWNYMCADCHSTNLQKNYDHDKGEYHTSWSEIDVSCEACHGPGSLHVELASSNRLFWDRIHGKGLTSLKSKSAKPQLDSCAKCHSHRRVLSAHHVPGTELLDHYAPSLIDSELYFEDGQIREEVYVYGSFLQSRMYREGVRCTDCHDPHSTKLVATGNQLCTQCHLAAKFDTPSHHHHPVESKGALCVECHMPTRTYMGVDARRDHSIRIPRPDISAELKTPNACNKCHDDETPQWAAASIVEWFGPKRPDDPHFAPALALGRRGDPGGEPALLRLWERNNVGPIVRASAVSLMHNYRSRKVLAATRKALEDSEPLVRGAAVRNVEQWQLEDAPGWLAPLLSDPVRLVRTEAARALAPYSGQLDPVTRQKLERGIEEYIEGQIATSDHWVAHHNLGIVYASLGENEKAVAAYRDSLKIAPDFLPARYNLAMLYNTMQQASRAEEALKQVVQRAPKNPLTQPDARTMFQGEAEYALGLLIAEDEKRTEEAIEYLRAATKRLPDRPRVYFNLGMALKQAGRLTESATSLEKACNLAGGDVDIWHALLLAYESIEQWQKAQQVAQYLSELQPTNPLWLQHVSQLKKRTE